MIRFLSRFFVSAALFVSGMLLGYAVASTRANDAGDEISAAVEHDSATVDPHAPIPF